MIIQQITQNEFNTLRVKAAEGDVNAKLQVAYVYGNLDNFRNDKQAFDIYESLATQENILAQHNTALYLEQGKGVEQHYPRAIAWHKKAAEQGYGPSIVRLGVLYFHGKGIPQNYAKAIDYFKQAEKFNEADALFLLGVCYDKGLDVKSDASIAAVYYEQAAQMMHPDAIYQLSECYEEGKGVKKDLRKAINLLHQAAELKHTGALIALGNRYLNADNVIQNTELAITCFSNASKEGDPAGDAALGYIYESGISIEKNPELATSYYKKAAEKNHSIAQYHLAMAYLSGTGIRKDVGQAIYWLRKASDNDCAEASFQLGEYYVNEYKATDLANDYYSKAAKSNHPISILRLARYYRSLQQRDLSLSYYQRAAEAGNAEAQIEYGLLLDKNNALNHSVGISSGAKWFKRAMKEGYTKARMYAEPLPVVKANDLPKTLIGDDLYHLGMCYQKGLGVPQDDKKAVEYFLEAASDGSPYAMAELGRCFEEGVGTKISLPIALKYYKRSTKKGINNQRKIEELEEKLNGPKPLKPIENPAILADKFAKQNDYQRAFPLYKQAAEQGNVYAMGELAICYETGKGTGTNLQVALDWYKKSSAKGFLRFDQNIRALQKKVTFCYRALTQSDATSLYQMGKANHLKAEMSFTGSDKDACLSMAFDWFFKAAEKNLPVAHLELAKCYLYGKGTKVSLPDAYHHARLAARKGLREAQAMVYYFYRDGIGTEKCALKADYWRQLAATAGDADCQVALAQNTKDANAKKTWLYYAAQQHHPRALYEIGLGLGDNQDRFKFQLFKEAASLGENDAHADLAKLYEYGIGCQKDMKLAYKHYYEAASHGHVDAGFDVAFIETQQFKSNDKAFKWFKWHADHGGKRAFHWLGHVYQHGMGTAQDYKNAIFYYQKAIVQYGERDKTTFALGECYANADGELRNLPQAVYWYAKSAQKNYNLAKTNLESLLAIEKDYQYDTWTQWTWWFQSHDPKEMYLAEFKEALAGNVKLQLKIAKEYESGTEHVVQNQEKAQMWYQLANAYDDPIARERLQFFKSPAPGKDVAHEVVNKLSCK